MIDLFPAVLIFYSIGNTSLSRKGMQRRAAVSFQWKTAGLPLVREKSGKFKVREKSGNSVLGQGILEF